MFLCTSALTQSRQTLSENLCLSKHILSHFLPQIFSLPSEMYKIHVISCPCDSPSDPWREHSQARFQVFLCPFQTPPVASTIVEMTPCPCAPAALPIVRVSLYLTLTEVIQLMEYGLTCHSFCPSPWLPHSLKYNLRLSPSVAHCRSLHLVTLAFLCIWLFPPLAARLSHWAFPHRLAWAAVLGETTSHKESLIKSGRAAARTICLRTEHRSLGGEKILVHSAHFKLKRGGPRGEGLKQNPNRHQEPQSIWAGGCNGQDSGINFSEAKLSGNGL